MKKLLTVCLLLLCSGSVMAEKEQKTYLCITEIAGGIKYDSSVKSWKEAKFKTPEKYLIKFNDKDYPLSSATISEFGTGYPIYYCEEEGKYKVAPLVCHSPFGHFHFNKKTLRFLESYMLGYIDGIDNNDNTPLVRGGTCSPL